jgi:hypothetical protein
MIGLNTEPKVAGREQDSGDRERGRERERERQSVALTRDGVGNKFYH